MKKTDNKKTNKAKSTAAYSAVFCLALFIIFEILRNIMPGMSSTPFSTEYDLSLWRDLFFWLSAVTATAFIFLSFIIKFGLIKAIFFTVLADSFIAFILGGIMFILNVSVDISGAGVSNFDSIYYYLMSIMIMIISSAVFLGTALLYFLTLLTIFIINKLKSRENDPLPRKTQVHKG